MNTENFKEISEKTQGRGKWVFLLLVIAILFIFWLFYWSYQLILFIKEGFLFTWRDDIFYVYYPYTIWLIPLMLAILIMSINLWLLLANFIVYLIKPTRKIIEKEAELYGWPDFKSNQKILFIMLIVSFLFCLIFAYVNLSTYNALSYK